MEILTAIIPTIIDYTVRPLGRQVSYVIFYNSNLKDLRSTLKNFDAVKQRMKHAVEEVERKVNHKVEVDVRNWQTEADEISREAEALLDDEGRAKTKCLYICPNLISYHQLSRKSTKLVRKIEEHENKKEFPTISYNAALEDISAIASDEYVAFESRTSMVKDIITELKKPDINKIGVYGLGGVGKTTLAKEVYREAVKEKLFDDVVIILNVKERKDNEEIQKEIAEKFDRDVDESLKMGTRANLLWAKIKDRKTLIILDDVLGIIDFEAVGLVGVPTCNLLLTSRDQTVLSGMGMQKCFQLGLLSEEETWRLFEKMAGDVVKDDRIRKVATQLARRCGGLPVSVVTVARASREDSRLEVWKDALRRFKSFDKDGPAEKAKFTIEWSYNRLKGDELRPLFLLCGVIAGGSCSISLTDLFKYSMGLGLIKNVDTVEDARNSLHALVAKLKNSCLLLDSYDHSIVRMHELVRDVAVWIASDDQKAFSRAYGEEVKEWPTEDFLKKCTMMSLDGCMIPRLPEVPWECPELKLLAFANYDIGDSQEIPSKFFEGMKELKVLDVTKFSIQSLPPSLQSLKHLHTLCLDGCELVDITLVGQLTNLKILSLIYSKVKELPKEIGQLTRLQLLDLTGCSELVLILPGIISSLTRLEDLRVGIKSFKQWEGEGPTSGGSNATVSELKHLAELTALDIHVPDANLLPANLFSDKLERYTILIGDCWEYPDTYGTSSNMLKLKLTRRNQFDRGIKLLVKRCEQLYLDGKESGNVISFLFDSDAVEQLKCLHVQNNDGITYVINFVSWSYSHNTFPNLESLTLEDLVTLESVCYGQLVGEPFQKLKTLTLRNLPKLIGFFSKDKRTIGTDADEIVLEEEVGGPPRLFSNGEVKMPNLTTLIVDQCDSLRFLFLSSMAKCLRQLKNLKISNCQIMEEIVGNEENTNDMFDKLSRLELQHLPNLTRFSSGSYIKFPSLAYLDLDDCTKLETFIFDAKSENITTNKEERNIELFDEKVGFPSLKTLYIWDLPKLKTIFHNQLHSDSFGKLIIMDVRRCHSLNNIFGPSIMGRLNALEDLQIEQCQSLQVVYDSSSITQLNGFDCPNLNSVEICSCESLKNVFPASVAKDLKRLSKFSIKNCGLMEEIVVKEEGPQTTYKKFEFPKVTTMEFDNLPQLRSFYPGLHVSNWPSLNILKFTKCGGVKIFAAEFSTYQDKFKLGHPIPMEQPFFLIEKGKSFLNLEELMLDENTEIWYELYGPLPIELLNKVKSICFATSHPKSDVFFENLQNIEHFHVLSAPWKELFVHDHQGSSRGETHEVETLPRVKVLCLIDMPELIHLGMENSQPRGPVFPNLEFLHLIKCGRLKNLASTLISFQNLTILNIWSCHGLQYLIPYSVAKSLQQLKVLEVKSCQRMVEIVASKEDDPENEITFSCLQQLKLSGLPSLQGFCKGNCIFKVPSLKTLIVVDCHLIDLKISSDGLLQSGSRLQIAEETDDVLMLSYSKENDRNQTNFQSLPRTNTY
ncbi:disease resistance protein [Pyrus ussuriensis x Pyrus communis]|uniref:Disease resistance protein n=1 Tax=Pyrus ussuriensis x Pyrus communis TaxID=2448454 RepID=A0A5N5GFM3_9ROSA|nr:disease resistance protein [Pyrus ussuriensis x Pyrus communis]